MAAPKQPPIQQTNPQPHDQRFDALRTELDGKIDKKLSENTFFALLGTIILIILAAFGYFAYKFNSIDEKIDNLKTEVTIIKTKADEHKK